MHVKFDKGIVSKTNLQFSPYPSAGATRLMFLTKRSQ